MPKKVIVRGNEYHDSIQLMRVTETIRGLKGVTSAMVAMATFTNKQIMQDLGFAGNELQNASADDLIIAVDATEESIALNAIEEVHNSFRARESDKKEIKQHKTIKSAIDTMPSANLCVITVPGDYAYLEARKALELGLHTIIYSDNVPMEKERELKLFAQSKGLLCMGPDCGVVNLNGVAFLTASIVKQGPIGIVGASGSGTQLIACLIEREGLGVSQAIGVGGKDLKDEVGGLGMLAAINALENDPVTKVIVLVSRTPGPATLPVILERVKKGTKPFVIYFIGGDADLIKKAGALAARDLEDASLKAVDLALNRTPRDQLFSISNDEVDSIVAREIAKLKPSQKYLRGLFAGGTFCEEAMSQLRLSIGNTYSNAPLSPELKLEKSLVSYRHTVVDLGDEEFTLGRPHPVIDAEPIKQAILRDGVLNDVAVILLDFILGPAINPDPVGSVIQQIKEVKNKHQSQGGYLSVVASVCGTNGDPQNLTRQENMLREAGVVVMPSNAQASRMAGLIALKAEKK